MYCRGPWLRELIDGKNSVEVNGKTITAEMVLHEMKSSEVALGECSAVNTFFYKVYPLLYIVCIYSFI